MPEDLKQHILEHMKEAMRNKESVRLSTIRLLRAEIKKREIDEQTTLNDAGVLKVINKMIKQRMDAATQFDNANRNDLAEKERQEISILKQYLPEQLSPEAVAAAINKTIHEVGAQSMKDMGKVMTVLKPQLEGRTDMRTVSQRIKELLSH